MAKLNTGLRFFYEIYDRVSIIIELAVIMHKLYHHQSLSQARVIYQFYIIFHFTIIIF